MSEPIPESIPTSQDPRSKRPIKRRALTPVSHHASQVTALFAKPDSEIVIPVTSSALTKRGTLKGALPPPPEIVANVQGSSAGAGSGEFHVYKASRRREYERVKMMDEEVVREKADADFESRREELKKKDEEKTGKNRRRREKGKGKKKDGMGEGKDAIDSIDRNGEKKVVATHVAGRCGETAEEVDAGDISAMSAGEPGDLPAMSAGDVGVIIHDDD